MILETIWNVKVWVSVVSGQRSVISDRYAVIGKKVILWILPIDTL